MLSMLMLLMLACVAYGKTNYCNISADHTMCKYKQKGCTLGLLASGVSGADKAEILRIHNQLRRKVANGQQAGQPPASNMRELKWDDEIALIAQRWTDQCTYGHDANRNTAKYGLVGQNVAKTASTADSDKVANFTEAVVLWYNEVTKPGFNPKHINPYVFSSGTGHYTQVVWAETDRIGCGYAYYKKDTWYTKQYTCNYALSGNIQSKAMYRLGGAATACVGAKSTTYPGLCDS